MFAVLAAMLRQWGNPLSWIITLLLIIGLLVRARVTLAFMPDSASPLWFETSFAVLAGLVAFLTFVMICIVLLARLTPEQPNADPLWARAGGTFLIAILISISMVALSGSLLTKFGQSDYAQAAGEMIGDVVLIPAYVLIFGQLAGVQDADIRRALRILPTILASTLVVALGIIARGFLPKPGFATGLIPLLPSYALSAIMTVTLLLLAVSTSRTVFGTRSEAATFD